MPAQFEKHEGVPLARFKRERRMERSRVQC